MSTNQYSILQIRAVMLGEGHICSFGTLQTGHTKHNGHQRLQCWPFPNRMYHGYNREDFVFSRPQGAERFVLNLDNVWFSRLNLLFIVSVKIDGQEEPVDIECAYVSFCYEIKLEPSGTY